MPKFHMNPRTGRPGVCSATTLGGCPFGIADVSHRDSPEAVYEVIEQVFAAHLIPKPYRREGPPRARELGAILAWRNPAAGTVVAAVGAGASLTTTTHASIGSLG